MRDPREVPAGWSRITEKTIAFIHPYYLRSRGSRPLLNAREPLRKLQRAEGLARVRVQRIERADEERARVFCAECILQRVRERRAAVRHVRGLRLQRRHNFAERRQGEVDGLRLLEKFVAAASRGIVSLRFREALAAREIDKRERARARLPRRRVRACDVQCENKVRTRRVRIHSRRARRARSRCPCEQLAYVARIACHSRRESVDKGAAASARLALRHEGELCVARREQIAQRIIVNLEDVDCNGNAGVKEGAGGGGLG